MDYKIQDDLTDQTNDTFDQIQQYIEQTPVPNSSQSNKFPLNQYISTLAAVVNGGENDLIYDCLDELLDILTKIEDFTFYHSNEQLDVFLKLLQFDDIDIAIKSFLCINSMIKKRKSIGEYYFHGTNLIDLILQSIESNPKSALTYRFFDLISSFSTIDSEIHHHIITQFPISLWEQLLKLDSNETILDEYSKYIYHITSFYSDDSELQQHLLSIIYQSLQHLDHHDAQQRILKALINILNWDPHIEFNYPDLYILINSLLLSESKKEINNSYYVMQILSALISKDFLPNPIPFEENCIDIICQYCIQMEKQNEKIIALSLLRLMIDTGLDLEIILSKGIPGIISNQLMTNEFPHNISIECSLLLLTLFKMSSNKYILEFMQQKWSTGLFKALKIISDNDKDTFLPDLLFLMNKLIDASKTNENDIILRLREFVDADQMIHIQEFLDDTYTLLFDQVMTQLYGN